LNLPLGVKSTLLSPPSKAHAAEHHHATNQVERRVSQDGYVYTMDESSNGIHERKTDTGFFGHKEPVRGRKWDHARDGEPVIMKSGIPQLSSPWGTFIKASMYGPPLSEDSKRVGEEFLRQQTPGYEKPWRGDLESNEDPDSTIAGLLHSKKKRRTFLNRFQVCLISNILETLLNNRRVEQTSHAPTHTACISSNRFNNLAGCHGPSSLASSSFQ